MRMAFPDLKAQMRVLSEVFHLNGTEIRRQLEAMPTRVLGTLQNKGTYQRHINGANMTALQQVDLVNAACNFLNTKHSKDVTPKTFETNDHAAFCKALGVSRYALAQAQGRPLPIPEIFVDSLYQPSEAVMARVGHYLLFRLERDAIDPKAPYLQACAQIFADGDGRFQYSDFWTAGAARPVYTGFVFCVGGVTNIVGENARNKQGGREIWWCGLERSAGADESEMLLYGYVSDLRKEGALFVDRIVLVRVREKCWNEVLKSKVFYTDRTRVVEKAGEALTDYIDAWKGIDLRRPR
jgi:hypothetical protein